VESTEDNLSHNRLVLSANGGYDFVVKVVLKVVHIHNNTIEGRSPHVAIRLGKNEFVL